MTKIILGFLVLLVATWFIPYLGSIMGIKGWLEDFFPGFPLVITLGIFGILGGIVGISLVIEGFDEL